MDTRDFAKSSIKSYDAQIIYSTELLGKVATLYKICRVKSTHRLWRGISDKNIECFYKKKVENWLNYWIFKFKLT
jgi:hypothetical protein